MQTMQRNDLHLKVLILTLQCINFVDIAGNVVKVVMQEILLYFVDREYDPNKHCGVIVAETGKPCTRSLTCKVSLL